MLGLIICLNMLILIKVCKYFALLDLRLDFHELNVEEVN